MHSIRILHCNITRKMGQSWLARPYISPFPITCLQAPRYEFEVWNRKPALCGLTIKHSPSPAVLTYLQGQGCSPVRLDSAQLWSWRRCLYRSHLPSATVQSWLNKVPIFIVTISGVISCCHIQFIFFSMELVNQPVVIDNVSLLSPRLDIKIFESKERV